MTSITPAHDRTLDEVKSQVEESWREDQIASRLKTKAADLLDKLKSGSPLDAVAKTDDLKVETADKLRRGRATPILSTQMIASVFRTAKDAYGSAQGDKPDQWIVFRVTEVTNPPLDANSPAAKRIEEVVQKQESNDIFGAYVDWLEHDLGTTINQAALAQALGNGAPDTN